jgi:predicted nucleic acid-binding protein
MAGFLLDTDVIIWHLRGREETTEALKEIQRYGVPSCSALSILEVQLGVKKGEEGKTIRFLEALRVFVVDRSLANHGAQLIRECRGKGITLDIPDAVIAATCLQHDLILLTYNTRHYPIKGLRFYPLSPIGS